VLPSRLTALELEPPPQLDRSWELLGLLGRPFHEKTSRERTKGRAPRLQHAMRFNVGQTTLAWIEVSDLDAWYRAQLQRGALELL
jgi:hypothetical protein